MRRGNLSGGSKDCDVAQTRIGMYLFFALVIPRTVSREVEMLYHTPFADESFEVRSIAVANRGTYRSAEPNIMTKTTEGKEAAQV